MLYFSLLNQAFEFRPEGGHCAAFFDLTGAVFRATPDDALAERHCALGALPFLGGYGGTLRAWVDMHKIIQLAKHTADGS